MHAKKVKLKKKIIKAGDEITNPTNFEKRRFGPNIL